MIKRRFPKSSVVVLLLAFFAFFMSALISQAVFERLPHLEDEVAYLYQARTYAGGHLVVPTPQPQRAYWQPFLVDQGGLRFGKYTPGWSMQLALGVLMGQTWIINAFFSALTVALAYRLAREIFDSDVAVIAAALTAFSPMALLLDGTMMGHTSALFAATLFLYAYWRIERNRQKRIWGSLVWGALAGMALGLLVANRPISGIAIATPLILWSVIRLVRSIWHSLRSRRADETIDRRRFRRGGFATRPVPGPNGNRNVPVVGFFRTLSPLIVLSVIALMIASSVLVNNYAAVGKPTTDLYTLVWSYDQIGFGPCCGRSGHTLEKGIRQARFDLSLTASDLFGWQIGSMMQADGTMKPDVKNHLLTQANYWLELGISWILLPFAFLVAYRRKAIFIVIWVAVAYGLVRFALDYQGGSLMRSPNFSWLWIGAALIWLYLPLFFWRDRVRAWTWILWSAAVGLVVMQMAYWIGSQLYSTRYFFEGLTGIAIISALPLAWLARHVSRPVIYGGLALALAYSLYFYSTPRISVLNGFNFISQAQIQAVNARRTTNKPVLVLVEGSSVRWRAFGSLMGVTSPYLNSDIVAAWNYTGTDGPVKQQILDRFPDREVIEMNAQDNYWWFPDQPKPPQLASTG